MIWDRAEQDPDFHEYIDNLGFIEHPDRGEIGDDGQHADDQHVDQQKSDEEVFNEFVDLPDNDDGDKV